MDLKVTRKIIDAIHDGSLEKSNFVNFPVFNVQIPESCPGVENSVLNPKNTWADKNDFDQTLRKLGSDFVKNFKKFEEKASKEVINSGPKLD